MTISNVIPIKPVITPENKCSYCTNSTCCTYMTQQIDSPRSMSDFDTLLWQVSHENIQIYKDEGSWFLLANNSCNHLLEDGRCNIYETRPQICRDHSNQGCEFDGPAGPEDFEMFFPDYDSLEAYCSKRFKNWHQRFKKFKSSA